MKTTTTKFKTPRKPNKLYLKVLGSLGTDEWFYKEEGSWEDHDYALNHVCAIIKRECEKDKMELTHKEAETLLVSISHHAHAGYDSWDFSPLQIEAIKRTWRAYEKNLKKLLS
jgi:hypothetical protein